jgi:hypothetical protein
LNLTENGIFNVIPSSKIMKLFLRYNALNTSPSEETFSDGVPHRNKMYQRVAD